MGLAHHRRMDPPWEVAVVMEQFSLQIPSTFAVEGKGKIYGTRERLCGVTA